MAAASPTDKLYKEMRKMAADRIGGEEAFQIQSPTIRRAMVANAILAVIVGLAPYGDDAQLRQVAVDLYGKLTDDEELV